MAGSLRDQLLKAGVFDEKRARQVEQTERKRRKQQNAKKIAGQRAG